MSILYLYNGSTTHTLEQIQNQLKMKPEIASSALQAIVKAEILNVTQGSLDSGNATIALNETFQKYLLFLQIKFNCTFLAAR
jgi:hypothetical protein